MWKLRSLNKVLNPISWCNLIQVIDMSFDSNVFRDTDKHR